MRLRLFITFLFCFLCCPIFGQEDTIAPIRELDNIHTATLKTTDIVVDLSDPAEVDLCLKKLHNYKFLESITFEGEGNEGDLKKLIYRASVLKNLTNIIFKENELLKIPDNIAQLKNLQALTIEGNNELNYNDLCNRLKNSSLTRLELIDNDLKKAPENISELSSLKNLKISGNDQMDYTDLIEHLSKNPSLTTLSIPLNYITDLPKNIDKLRSLQVLDVSNNSLSELPGEISALKSINNMSIQGNLLLDPVKDLEKLKGNNIQYLSLDKEISGEDLEKIKKMFPEAHIDFPINKEIEETAEIKKSADLAVPTIYSGELSIKKETTVLSQAYLSYPSFFGGLTYTYDTLRFDERYTSKQYQNVYRLIRNGRRSIVTLYMRDKCARYEKPGKKGEIWFRFATDDGRLSANYPELRAFGGMYWVYDGDLSKQKFRKKYLTRRARPDDPNWLGLRKHKRRMPILWNDVRIEFEKNNSLFTIKLKCDTGFISFNAYPVISNYPIEKSRQHYNRRYLLYKKALLRREQRFNNALARDKNRYDVNYKKLCDYAWRELQIRMSNEEKIMPKEEWLEYYDKIIANEQKALDKTSLARGYVSRSLEIRGYKTATATPTVADMVPNTNNFGMKTFNADLVDSKDGGKLAVQNIFFIDNKNKTVSQANGTLGLTPNLIPVKQFASQSLLVEMRNGNWGYVSAAELDKQSFDPNKVFQFQTQVFDKNLDTVGDFLKDALK